MQAHLSKINFSHHRRRQGISPTLKVAKQNQTAQDKGSITGVAVGLSTRRKNQTNRSRGKE